MKAMPAMPKMGGVSHACICGCGQLTKRTWTSGHDGRANGWATRIEKGHIKLEDVPANERNGAIVMLKARGIAMTTPEVKATPKTPVPRLKKAKATDVRTYINGITIPGATKAA